MESIANLAAVDADIFQIPIAKVAQGEKVRLALTVCDHAVDETAEARQKNSDSSADHGRGVACRGVEHRHGFFLSKGLALRASPFCWDQHARCRVPGLSENDDLSSKCP
jgi:hypothetical protein